MMDKIAGLKISNWDLSIFIELHPLFWGVGYLSFDNATAITVGCFTIGVEY